MRVLNNSAAVSKDIDADKRKEKRVVEHPWQKTLSAVQRAVHKTNERKNRRKEKKRNKVEAKE
jgi:fructose-specific phosphotransferase system component IIB